MILENPGAVAHTPARLGQLRFAEFIEHGLAPGVAARLERNARDRRLEFRLRALPHGRADEHAPADHAQAWREVAVEKTHPPAHAPALLGIRRPERRSV